MRKARPAFFLLRIEIARRARLAAEVMNLTAKLGQLSAHYLVNDMRWVRVTLPAFNTA